MAALNPKIEQNLFAALKDLQRSSSLSPEDMERVSHFAVRLITEYSLLKSEEEEGQAEHTNCR